MPNNKYLHQLLHNGYSRHLAASEIERGYVYVSSHPALPNVLNTKDFTLELNGREFHSRKINVSGRVSIPREFLRAIGPSSLVRINIASKTRLILSILE